MPLEARGYIYRNGKVSRAALAGLLSSGPRWAYVETPAEATFKPCVADLLSTWPRGRAFGAKQSDFAAEAPVGLEVRWQALDAPAATYQVEVLTEDAQWRPPDSGWQRSDPVINGRRTREILLWGEMGKTPSAAPTWIEIRIPQPLQYPIPVVHPPDPDAASLSLRVLLQAYDYTVNGVTVATRWAWLRQGSDSPEQKQV